MSRNEKKIRDALTAIGYEAERVWWEPLGPSLEMCGPTGGWFVDDEAVGLNIEQAVAFIAMRPTRFRESS